jgi:mannose-6-phosphate isomerase-like protein (cupin superfamily)
MKATSPPEPEPYELSKGPHYLFEPDRRDFLRAAGGGIVVFLVLGEADARRHYHRRLTETYFVLECGADAFLELDGDRVPVRPGVCVLLPPGVRHWAVGRMRVLILVLPKFDPADEWFD